MVLSDLTKKESGIIVKVHGNKAFRIKITEMGFVRGQKITVIKNAPLKDPIEYSIMGYRISLRRAEAAMIEVIKESGITEDKNRYDGIYHYSDINLTKNNPGKTIHVGLVGNPNSGKTSLFNYASNSKEHVGNYAGVTIGIKQARIKFLDYTIYLTDLPGTYSLSSYSPEEIFVRNYIFDKQPDIIVNVIDSTNLERNLFLSTQLAEMNIRMVIALNMYDELLIAGDRFDYISFGKMTGIPVIPTIGSKGKGLAQLFNAIISKYKERTQNYRRINITYDQDTEKSLLKIENIIREYHPTLLAGPYPAKYIAIKVLEKDEYFTNLLQKHPASVEISEVVRNEISRLESLHYEDSSTLITNAKYGFINGLLKETYTVNHLQKKKRSAMIDGILTHKIWGLPFFLFFLWIMFQATFKLGQYPMNWIDLGIKQISALGVIYLPPGDLKNMIIQGIIGGIGGVIIFLPNILILFLCIAIMEGTGYMARAAFLMDRVMHKVGLHGKSFIPMVMGLGCNVPAILSTRIIESRNNRIITMLIIPFMSCSARLPVYILIIGTFFPAYQGSILLGIYLFGIILAGMTAILLKRFHFRQDEIPFVMELPPYRIPTIRNTIKHMINKAGQYLQKIGGIILVASIIIWGLGYYPKNQVDVIKTIQPSLLSSLKGHSFSDKSIADMNPGSFSSSSYLERLGKAIEPVLRPIGFDWKMGVSILAGVGGKEIVVSTMSVLYQEEGGSGNMLSLGERLKNQRYNNGLLIYTPLTSLSFLAFILVYFPCLAVIISIAKEAGSAWWSIFLIVYTTVLAWLISFIIYQSGILLML